MVRRSLILVLVATACSRTRPMADKVEVPHMDSSVMTSHARMDSMLDTMPGGLMAKGNDSAAKRLIKKKM